MRFLNLDRVLVPVGALKTSPELCKGCGFCIEFCPKGVLEFSEDVNLRGYHYPQVKKGMEFACTACGMCQRICPDYAIYLEKVLKIPAKEVILKR